MIDPDDLDDLTRHATLDDELESPGPSSHDDGGRERRHYVQTIADAPADDPERLALLGRIAIRKVAAGSAPRVMAGATLGEATRAIRRSTGRDRVGELVIDTLERFAPGCEAAIMLVIRGATAVGWKGFLRGGGALAEIAVPIEDGGLVPQAVELNVTLRRSCTELDAIDRLLLASLGRTAGDLVVVPISIADQVLCVIAIATAEGAPIASAEPIAAAAGAAFARLMRDASSSRSIASSSEHGLRSVALSSTARGTSPPSSIGKAISPSAPPSRTKPFQPIAVAPRITSMIAASHPGANRSSVSITSSPTRSLPVPRRIARVASPSVAPAMTRGAEPTATLRIAIRPSSAWCSPSDDGESAIVRT